MLARESYKKKEAEEERKEKLRLARAEKAAKKRQEEEERLEKERLEHERRRNKERQAEMTRQKSLHSHHFPYVHHHALAEHNALQMRGCPRRSECDICRNRNIRILFAQSNPPKYTCEECDWDICDEHFREQNISAERKKELKKERQKKAEAERLQLERRWQQEEEEERIRWDADTRFPQKIRSLAAKNKNSNSPLKFTVWCSDGYDYDGWHSYAGPPEKEFDSSWATKKEANQRAEYLFFWKNPWGIEPTEISDDYQGEPKAESKDGMDKWTVSPADSSRWTVGVTQANVYPHLENASSRRHHHDEPTVEMASEVFF